MTLALPCTVLLSLLFRSPLFVSLNNSLGLLFLPNPSLHPTSPTLPGLPLSVGKLLKEVVGSRGEGRSHWVTEGRWQYQTKRINTLIKWPRKPGAEDGSGGEGSGKR